MSDTTAGTDPMNFAEAWNSIKPGEKAGAGKYSVYRTHDDSLLISYRPDGTDEDQHLEIPSKLMGLMIAASEGKGPLARMRALMGGGM